MHNFLQKKAKEKKENKKVKIYIHRGELVGQRFPSPSSASSPPMASTTRGECENTGSASLQQQRAAGRARATSPRQEEGTQPVRPCAEREPPAGREREREPSLEPPRSLEALLTGNLRLRAPATGR